MKIRKFLAVMAALLLLWTAAGCRKAEAGTALTVYAFAGGAADAFLLTTAHSAVLIDCGERDLGHEIVRYLGQQGIDRLDCLLLTHFDKDHVGGAAAVLSAVDVDRVLQSNRPKDSDDYERYVEALEAAGIEAETVREALTFTLDGVAYDVDPPDGDYEKDKSNNSSLITTVRNGGDTLLFMGDAEEERVLEFLQRHSARCDFLKVPHHGRLDDLSAKLIASARPDVAVITSSEEEPEDAAVVAMLQKAGAEVFRTREGPVLVESSGQGVTARYG